MSTTTVFNTSTRNRWLRWRALGVCPNHILLLLQLHYPEEVKGSQKSFCFNRLLDKVLESFINTQQPGALDNIRLRLDTYEKVVSLKAPLFFVIGDIQGCDKIAGRYNSHSSTIAKCISRTCNAGPEH